MKRAVTAHVNMFQELAAAFMEQQAVIVMKLQDYVELRGTSSDPFEYTDTMGFRKSLDLVRWSLRV
jgi:hypothetical protein